MIGPITSAILGLILLAVLVTVLVKGAQYMGWIDGGLATKIVWGTGVVILVIIALLVIRLILGAFNLPIHMP
jgi:hypothetical protein